MDFAYTVKKGPGTPITGSISADDSNAAWEALRNQGYTVVQLEAVKKIKIGLNMNIGGPPKPSLYQLAVFAEQFSAMLNAGVPILKAMRGLAEQQQSKGFKAILEDLYAQIESGITLSDAMKRHPQVFSSQMIASASSGETAGNADLVWSNLGMMLKKDVALRGKVKTALTYPAIVLVLSLAMTYFLMTKMVPQFAGILKEMGGPLPPITVFTLALSSFLSNQWYIVLLLNVGTVIAVYRYSRTKTGRYQLSGLLLRVPIFGPLQHFTILSRLCRSMAVMIESGLKILEVLAYARGIAGNALFEEALTNIATAASRGEPIHQEMRKYKRLFPIVMVQMMEVGEDTSKIDALLHKQADFYDDQASNLAAQMASLIEPIMTVGMGGITFFIVASIFLPYFSILQSVMK